MIKWGKMMEKLGIRRIMGESAELTEIGSRQLWRGV